jgi:hypothetical protein
MDHFSGSTCEAPLVAMAHTLDEQLKQAEGNDPTFLSVLEKEEVILTLASVLGRVEGFLVDTLAVAGDVADEHGARSAGAWLAAVTHDDGAVAGRLQRLATETERHPEVRNAMRDGRISPRHAQVIIRAVDAFGPEVPAAVRDEAVAHLLALAGQFTPKELRRLGDGILAVIDPASYDEAERAKLEAELARARAATRLTIRPDGEGTARISGVLPESVAERLRKYLHAFSAPRHDAATGGSSSESRYLDPVTGKRLPHERVMGEAFTAFLEAADPDRMPIQGGDATQVIVTIAWEKLLAGVGVGMADSEAIPVSEVRRLACQAKILPAVLGGKSEVLDLGRSQRLFTKAQRKAMVLRQQTCAFEGCDVPIEWCEAHHLDPWSSGGRTDLANCVGCCPRHHHVIHDPRYVIERPGTGAFRAILRT